MQVSKAFGAAVVMAILLSLNAPMSFALAQQSASATSFCAHEVPSGSTVNPSADTIVLSNGSAVALSNFPCSMTSVVWGTTGHPAEGDLTMSGSNHYSSFQDEWTSPPAPSSGSFSSPEGVALYDGLQNSNDIVQPLLVYGCITTSDCSNSWRLTAYADMSGTLYYVTPLSSSQGDTIQGTVTLGDYLACSGGSGSGQGYNIDAQIVSGSSVSLNVCTYDLYQNAAAGSIEVHDLSTCTQMPGTTSDDFGSISWGGSISVTESTAHDVTFCTSSATWYSSPTVYLNLQWHDS